MATRRRPVDAQERAFLAAYDPYAFPPTAVTVDIVILTVRQGELSVLLVRRASTQQVMLRTAPT